MVLFHTSPLVQMVLIQFTSQTFHPLQNVPAESVQQQREQSTSLQYKPGQPGQRSQKFGTSPQRSAESTNRTLLILNVKLHIPSPRGAQKGQGVSDCMGKLSGLEWSNLLEYNFKSELPGLSLNTSHDMTL